MFSAETFEVLNNLRWHVKVLRADLAAEAPHQHILSKVDYNLCECLDQLYDIHEGRKGGKGEGGEADKGGKGAEGGQTDPRAQFQWPLDRMLGPTGCMGKGKGKTLGPAPHDLLDNLAWWQRQGTKGKGKDKGKGRG